MSSLRSTIIFDLDGTLIDSAPVVTSILNTMRLARGMEAMPLSVYRSLSSEGGAVLVGRALEVAPELAGGLVSDFRTIYAETATPLESVYPHVRETLQELSRRGVRMTICSNKPEKLCRKVLGETDLLEFFEGIVGGDTLPFRKPHRAPVDLALNLCHGNAKTLYVGDSAIDQQAALAASLRFVFFSGGYENLADSPQIFRRIDVMDELLELVSVATGAVGETDWVGHGSR